MAKSIPQAMRPHTSMQVAMESSVDAELELIVERVRRLTLNDPTILDLNHDVLQYLMGHIPPRDAWRFAMTSRAAYRLALPRYLSQVVLNCTRRGRTFFSTRNRAAAFCKYFLADDARCRALRDLTIIGTPADVLRHDWESGDGYDIPQGLRLVLSKACLLRNLSLPQYSPLVSVLPWLSDIIPRLAHLRTLHLGIALSEDVSGMLAHAQTSCRALSRVSLQLYVHRFMRIPRDLGPVAYHTVDKLVVYGELHSLEAIADKFPNLRTLDLIPFSDFADQHFHSVPEDKWTQLDRVSTVTPLPRMPTVRHLGIYYTLDPGDGNTNYLRMTSDRTESMIRAMRPVVVDCYASDALLRLLGEHAMDLKFVRLHVKNTLPSGEARKVDLETTTDGVIARLSSSPLRGLMILTDDTFPYDCRRKCAEKIGTRLKQLEYVGIARTLPSGWPWDGSRCTWFKIVRRSGRVPAVKLLAQEVYDELVTSQRS